MPRKQNTRKESSSFNFRTPPASRCSAHCRIDLCASESCNRRYRATAKAASSTRAISSCGPRSCAPRKQSCSAIQTGRRISSKTKRAHDVPTVNKLLADLAPPAVGNAKREAADMQKIVDEEKGGFKISACGLGLLLGESAQGEICVRRIGGASVLRIESRHR